MYSSVDNNALFCLMNVGQWATIVIIMMEKKVDKGHGKENAAKTKLLT